MLFDYSSPKKISRHSIEIFIHNSSENPHNGPFLQNKSSFTVDTKEIGSSGLKDYSIYFFIILLRSMIY